MRKLRGYTSQEITNFTQIAANAVVVAGVVVALVTLRHTDRIDSGQLMVNFNNELRNSQTVYPKMIAAIANGEPLLTGNNPSFTGDDIDSYLVMWETLDNLYDHKLISEGMVYDAFSYDVEVAYCNPEVRTYISQQRALDPNQDLYGGFEELALRFMKLDGSAQCEKIP